MSGKQEIEQDVDASLIEACKLGDLNLAKAAIKRGANPNYQNSHGATPFHFASRSGMLDLVQFLAQTGVSLNALDNFGRNALHYAVPELTDYEDYSIDPDSDKKYVVLAGTSSVDVIAYLLKIGVDPTQRDILGYNPYDMADNNLDDVYMELCDESGQNDDKIAELLADGINLIGVPSDQVSTPSIDNELDGLKNNGKESI